jgi:EmrB/QacA subfamily drug resistance transporter
MLGTISAVLTATMINVAIPDIMGAYGIGQDRAQWLSTGFLAAMTVSMLLNDWMTKAVGMRATYIGAMAVFAAGSLIGSISPNIDLLIAARMMQGAGAGLVQPLSMVIFMQVFPPNQRGKAMGMFGMGVVLAPAFGPALGGVLVDAYNWRAVFLAAIPVASLGVVLAGVFMPWRDPKSLTPKFDWIGLALLVTAVGCLLTGLSDGQRIGWETREIATYFVVAFFATTFFIVWELLTPNPLLEVRLYGNLKFAMAALAGAIFGGLLFGTTYLIPLFVQTIGGYTPTKSGLLMIPPGIIMLFMFPTAGRLADRFSPHYQLIVGMSVFAISCVLMTAADSMTPFWVFAGWLIFGRGGMSLCMPALTVAAMRTLAPHQSGQGSGAVNFSRQLGGAFGVNILAITLERRTELHLDRFEAAQSSGNSATLEILSRMQAMLAKIPGLGEQQIQAAAHYVLEQNLYQQASMMAFRDDFLLTGALSALALIPAVFLREKSRTIARMVTA